MFVFPCTFPAYGVSYTQREAGMAARAANNALIRRHLPEKEARR